MATRYNQPNRVWQIYGNQFDTVSNGNMVFTAKDGSGVMTLVDGALRVPFGVSAERPVSSSGGMIRYNTTDNLVEYYNAGVAQWLPISLPPPTLSQVTPNFIAENVTNTYTLAGSNFSNLGFSVVFTGLNGAGTVYTPNTETFVNDNLVTVEFDASNAFVDASNQLPMSATLTNDNSGFSSTLLNAVISFNVGPSFVSPPNPAPSIIDTFPVQDPSASFILQGIDISTPLHYPLTFSIASGNPGGITDISSIGDLSAVFKVPAGNRTDTTVSTYNFFAQVADASGAISEPVQYRVSLANPLITTIDPSYLIDASVSDVTITGNYFVIDSDISFTNTGTSEQLVKTGVTYNSETSLTVSDVSAGSVGTYELSVRNGSVLVSVPSLILNVVKLVDYSITGFASTTTKYYDEAGSEVGGPVLLGETLIYFETATTGSIAFSNLGTTIQAKALIVGGGGAGGFGHGGGGAGGAVLYRTNQSITNGTYPITVGAGGPATTSDASVTATGGGSGANENGNDSSGRGGAGGNGANGGGGSYGALSGGTGTAPTAAGWTVYAGFNGGTGNPGAAENYGCGGGGGAGGAGQTAVNPAGGNGANGIQINIDGNNYYWGAGGGGVTFSTGTGTGLSGSGGLGGGGGACSVNGTPGSGGGSALNNGGNGQNGAETPGGAGGANTGSGGGGGANENGTGGAGGSGIVIIRFPSYAL